MKRSVSFVLALLMVITIFPVIALPAVAEGELPEGAIPISTIEELDMICNEYPANGYYYLTNDIDMSDATASQYGDFYNGGSGWMPIGTSSIPFSGTFDGQGHTISGLNINRPNSDKVGLFGCISNATIENVNIKDSDVIANDYVGLLCGYSTGESSISNSNVLGTITGNNYLAGVVGFGETLQISNCQNKANIISNATDGSPVETDLYLGGIVSKVSNGIISKSANFGEIEYLPGKVRSIFAGGIAGYSNSTVSYCRNEGNISVNNRTYYTNVNTSSSRRIGGVCGFCNEVLYSINKGNIVDYSQTNTPSYCAGIAGKSNTIQNCINYGEAKVAIGCGQITASNCINVFPGIDMFGPHNYYYNVMYHYYGTYNNCYNTDGIIAPYNNALYATYGTANNCYYYAPQESGIGELRTKRQLRIQATFENWDFDNIWTMEGNEDYLYPELQGLPMEYEKSITGISMAASFDKTSYLEGKETLDVTGGQIKISYDNDTTEKIDITSEMVSGFDNTKLGEQTLTISYQGFSTTTTVAVNAKAVSSVAVTTMPGKVEYLEGKESFSATGGKLTVYYNNDTQTTIDLTNSMVSGFSNATPGTVTLTASYGGKSCTFDVAIKAKSLSSIAVTQNPSKTNYLESKDAFNPAGGKVTLYYDNDTSEIIDLSECDITGFDNSKIGKCTLVVEYGGKETSFDVTIAEKSLSSISVTKKPTKLEYLEAKDSIDISGGEITLYYDNGTSKTIDMTSSMISGFDNTKVGSQSITVTYGGKKTTYNVTIKGKTLTKMEVSKAPTKLMYAKGKDSLDVTGGTIKLYYNNDTSETMNMSPKMISGFSNSELGIKTLTVTYLGFTDTYDIEVTELEKIEILSLPTNTSFFEETGALDVTGGKLKLYYANGKTDVVDMSSAVVTGFDNSVIGAQTLTVYYDGKTATYDINIIEKSLTSISLTKSPSKNVYFENEDFVAAPGVLTCYYDNGSIVTVDLTASMVTGFDNAKVGNQELTITYQDKTTSYEVIVKHNLEKIDAVEATHNNSGNIEHYKCSICGRCFSDAEGLNELLEEDYLIEQIPHSFTRKLPLPELLKSEANCQSPAVYYYVCTCGAVGSETYTYGSTTDHKYDQMVTSSDYLRSAATCKSPAVYYYSCSCGACGTTTFESGTKSGHVYVKGKCKFCGVSASEKLFADSRVKRISGDNRYQTSIKIADALKTASGVTTFDTIIVAYGKNYADALAGSYLATLTGAPILIVDTNPDKQSARTSVELIKNYISKNLSENGLIYILGGESVVSKDFENSLYSYSDNVIRLAGKNRYSTNIAILDECLKYNPNPSQLIVCDANGYADSLSASSLGQPILLINKNTKTLTNQQKDYLTRVRFNKIYVIGGTSAVPRETASYISAYGVTPERIYGSNRYETSANIASKLYSSPNTAIFAYGGDFPDGLCGGPLAYTLGAPLILTKQGSINPSCQYVEDNSGSLKNLIFLGGTSVIPESLIPLYKIALDPNLLTEAEAYDYCGRFLKMSIDIYLQSAKYYQSGYYSSSLQSIYEMQAYLVKTMQVCGNYSRLGTVKSNVSNAYYASTTYTIYMERNGATTSLINQCILEVNPYLQEALKEYDAIKY